MSLQCNIDARGKRVRLINGIVALCIGLATLLIWAILAQSLPGWIVSGTLIVAGGFSIFEARAGWCVVRAMGFKTRI